MKRKKHSIRKMLLSCHELGPEDGLDPRYEARGERARAHNRKALQLCGQVARTLQTVLAGECADDWLRELQVESVVPAPNSGRLLVTLSLVTTGAGVPVGEVLARLHRAQGMLRSELAAAISRRRVPELTFRLIGPPDLGPSDAARERHP
jgi:ribosome-binding factor A